MSPTTRGITGDILKKLRRPYPVYRSIAAYITRYIP